MGWKELAKEKKVFLVIGIPCIVFITFIFLSFYLLFASFYLLALIVLALGFAKRERAWGRATKVSVLMVILFFVQFYNFSTLPGQFQRHLPGGRQALINENDPRLETYHESFLAWHQYTHGVDFDALSDEDPETLRLKMKRVDHWIYYWVFEYTSDIDGPNPSFEHVANLDEIFNSDTDDDGLLEDDCDGITVFTVSLLIHMGYNAYVSECLGHWNSIVFPEGTDPHTPEGFEQGIHLYNSWDRPSYYVFNDEELFTPPGRPFIVSLWELFLEGRTYDSDYLDYFRGHYLDLPLGILLTLLYVMLFLASLFIYYVVKLGHSKGGSLREDKLKWFLSKNGFKMALQHSIAGSFVAFVLFWLAISGLGGLGNAILVATLILLIRRTDWEITRQSRQEK